MKSISKMKMESVILRGIRLYQNFISPSIGRHCRFYPSCSEYACQSLEKHGVLRGSWKSIRRILRCGPWSGGGIDQP